MEPTINITPTPWYKRKLLWIFALILILIPFGAWVYATYFMKSATPSAPLPPAAKNTLEEDSSPIAFDILKNPLVYEWRGSVEGTLTAKDEKSITLTDDKGNKITIIVQSSSKEITGTTFYRNKPTKDPRTNFIALEDIPLGIKLAGDFFVFPQQQDKMFGSSFIVFDK